MPNHLPRPYPPRDYRDKIVNPYFRTKMFWISVVALFFLIFGFFGGKAAKEETRFGNHISNTQK